MGISKKGMVANSLNLQVHVATTYIYPSSVTMFVAIIVPGQCWALATEPSTFLDKPLWLIGTSCQLWIHNYFMLSLVGGAY